MAGKEIYIGRMLEDLQEGMSDLKSDMATMSAGMADMVEKLIIVGQNTSQTIQSLKVRAADNVMALFPGVSLSQLNNGSELTWGQTVFTFKSMSEGTARLVHPAVPITATMSGTVYGTCGIRILRKTNSQVIATKATSDENVSVTTAQTLSAGYIDFPVIYGQEYYIQRYVTQNNTNNTRLIATTIEANTFKLAADLVNLAAEGGFLVVS